MIEALHFDGLVLLVASLLLATLAQGYYRWLFRVPMFTVAAFNFALAINLLGVYSIPYAPHWFWLRLISDLANALVWGIYIVVKHRDARGTAHHVHAAYHR